MLFGGRSPINDECRRLVAALEASSHAAGRRFPSTGATATGTRCSPTPLAQMAATACRRAVAVATSAYSSYSACRQYLEDIDHARARGRHRARRDREAPALLERSGFIETMIGNTHAAAARPIAAPRGGHEPASRVHRPLHPDGDGRDLRLRGRAARRPPPWWRAGTSHGELGWDLVYQSRSGAPRQPWLDPDVCDHLRALHARGTARRVVPIGFVADHMEVVYDLDTQARAVADSARDDDGTRVLRRRRAALRRRPSRSGGRAHRGKAPPSPSARAGRAPSGRARRDAAPTTRPADCRRERASCVEYPTDLARSR